MYEAITLSCSQSAGHVAAQLYNVQESHIPYRKSAVVLHHNDVFLDPVRVHGRTNYYPRNISVQYAGGYGGLRKHEYSEKTPDPASLVPDKAHIIDQKVHEKHEFQQGLDAGKPADAALLTPENTRFWTDYNKLIYRPLALLELQNYGEDERHRNFPRMSFRGSAAGHSEFLALEDVLDDNFRRQLEHADCIQGINIFTELDSAWGAFSGAALEHLKDEYFNSGTKQNLWVYGFYGHVDGHVRATSQLESIRAFSDFAQNATLFFPMRVPASDALLPAYDPKNLWHLCAVRSVFVNSLWSLNCSMQEQVKMDAIESNLLRGYEKRNVVNEIRIVQEQTPEAADVTGMSAYDFYAEPKRRDVRFGFSSTSLADISCNVVKSPADKRSVPSPANVYENAHFHEILELSTFPNIMSPAQFSVEFGTSSLIRDTLKEHRQMVSRARMQEHTDAIGGDKAELVEHLSNLIDEYAVGYSDESDYE